MSFVFFSLGGVGTGSNESSPDSLFTIHWLTDGHVTIKSTNGKYITARMNGSLFATSETATEKEKYFITLINRPILVLKSDYGLVGFKSSSNSRIECNKANHDVIILEHDNGNSGSYFLKRQNGKYWAVDSDGMINADSDSQTPFNIELYGYSKMAIKAANGSYLRAEQNGIVCAKENEIEKATLWEY